MVVIVQVSQEVARELNQQSPPTQESEELKEALSDLGVKLEPLHPGVQDPQLSIFFKIELPDAAAADQVIERLLQTKGVEAAYAKPPDEAP